MTTGTALRIVVLGLTISSSWGNGHATSYRSLLGALGSRGHRIHFLERDLPWYASQRDCLEPAGVSLDFYGSLTELKDRFGTAVREADVVIVGSFVPEGVQVGDWVAGSARGLTAFYDIDTPVTLARLLAGEEEYLATRQIAQYDLYLSFTGGPTLKVLEDRFDSPRARVLYCSVDPDGYYPEPADPAWDLGYMGTFSPDRQPGLEALLLDAARAWPEGRFNVTGPQYPADIGWPRNVGRIEHLPPAEHRGFYNRQRFTLNLTRSDMATAGWSPSVRLFEAAACATPIVSDRWAGIETLFRPGIEIVLASSTTQVLRALRDMDEDARRQMGERARRRALAEHTAGHRAAQLESYLVDALASPRHQRPFRKVKEGQVDEEKRRRSGGEAGRSTVSAP